MPIGLVDRAGSLAQNKQPSRPSCLATSAAERNFKCDVGWFLHVHVGKSFFRGNDIFFFYFCVLFVIWFVVFFFEKKIEQNILPDVGGMVSNLFTGAH